MAQPCVHTKEGATELLHESMQQTREAQQVAKKATAAFRMTLDGWLGGTDGCASQYRRF